MPASFRTLSGMLAVPLVAAAITLGCSATPSAVASSSADEDAGTQPDTGAPPRRPGHIDVFGPTGPACASPVRSDYPAWRPPLGETVCTEADVAAFQDIFRDRTLTTPAARIAKLEADLPPACVACAVSDGSTATAWGALVKDGAVVHENLGACFAAAPGGSAACGKARQEMAWCLLAGCGACPRADAEECQTYQLEEGSCREEAEALGAVCGQDLQGLFNVCTSLSEGVRWACGPRTAAPPAEPDAGP